MLQLTSIICDRRDGEENECGGGLLTGEKRWRGRKSGRRHRRDARRQLDSSGRARPGRWGSDWRRSGGYSGPQWSQWSQWAPGKKLSALRPRRAGHERFYWALPSLAFISFFFFFPTRIGCLIRRCLGESSGQMFPLQPRRAPTRNCSGCSGGPQGQWTGRASTTDETLAAWIWKPKQGLKSRKSNHGIRDGPWAHNERPWSAAQERGSWIPS